MTPPKFALFGAVAGLAVSAAASAQQSLLLIPDSGGDRISSFDPATGALVNLNFIPKDGRMKQVVQVVQTPWNTLLMTDFEANSIWEYGLDGQYIHTFVNTEQLGFPTAPGRQPWCAGHLHRLRQGVVHLQRRSERALTTATRSGA